MILDWLLGSLLQEVAKIDRQNPEQNHWARLEVIRVRMGGFL